MTNDPVITHTDRCNALTVGAAALNMIASGEHILYLDEIGEILAAPRARCTCGPDALRKVEADLTAARKRERALKASPAFGGVEYGMVCRTVADLLYRRDAIREAIA